MLVIEANQVGRLSKTSNSETAGRAVTLVVWLVGIRQCHVGVEAETAITKHVLPSQLPTPDAGIRAIHLLCDGEYCLLTCRGVDNVVNGLTLRTFNDEVGHVLEIEV